MADTPAHRLFKRALAESIHKQAFVPMTNKEGQAAGPGGMPVDPAAGGGAPMDPAMAGGAPMDPAMGGMPPMDPMAAAMGGMPPLPPEGEEVTEEVVDEASGGADVSMPDIDAMQSIQANTMDIVRQTLEMVGKAKPVEGGDVAGGEAAAPKPAEEPAAAEMPGPITGQPGFDPNMVNGPLKLASAARTLKHVLSKRK